MLSRAGRAVASAVVGRLALFDRFTPEVVELDAVDAAVVGRVARKKQFHRIKLSDFNLNILFFSPVARVCDVGRSFVTLLVVLLAAAPVERADADAEPEAVEGAFAGTLLDV